MFALAQYYRVGALAVLFKFSQALVVRGISATILTGRVSSALLLFLRQHESLQPQQGKILITMLTGKTLHDCPQSCGTGRCTYALANCCGTYEPRQALTIHTIAGSLSFFLSLAYHGCTLCCHPALPPLEDDAEILQCSWTYIILAWAQRMTP